MQFSETKSTMPLVYLTMAPGAGQAFRQPGSSQCMQPSLRISHSRRPDCTSTSENLITVQDAGVRSRGLSYVPSLSPTESRRSFHCMQATWHALQPMQLVTSISLATSAPWRTEGEGVVVAERAAMSSDCSDDMAASSGSLDVHDEGLVFWRMGIGVADKWR